MEESDIASMSSKFECVKIAMTQDKNGHILKLAIHPNDTPEDIMRDMVGMRYMAVLVRISDEGQPVPSVTSEEGTRAVRLAGTLCSDEKFQQWMVRNNEADEMTETSVAAGLRRLLDITSRKELKTNSKARSRLLAIRDEFADDLRKLSVQQPWEK